MCEYCEPTLASVANTPQGPFSYSLGYIDKYPIYMYRQCGAHVGAPPVFGCAQIQLCIFVKLKSICNQGINDHEMTTVKWCKVHSSLCTCFPNVVLDMVVIAAFSGLVNELITFMYFYERAHLSKQRMRYPSSAK